MCSIMDIVIPIVRCFCEPAIGTVKTHGGYVYRYKKNLTDVEHEMEKVERHLGIIKGKVEEAETRGEIVEPNVVQWLEKAHNMKSEVDEFIRTASNNENKHCFKCSCPNLIFRYKMSKLALEKTGKISGDIEGGGKFDQVARRAPLPVLPSNDYMNFESRSPLSEMIKQKLATVNMIGVYGIGGVGKTTIVEEVRTQVQKEGLFDEAVVAVVSQDVNVRKIQGQIADRLNPKLVWETEDGRAGELWNRLNNGKKNLVILDDLWEELNLKTIGIPLRNGDKGCKVILTTRDRHVLIKMQVAELFQVHTLSESEAWDLFKNKSGNTFDSAILQSVAKLVCKECGGLPIAILAVAGALKGKNEHAWEDALNQLQNSSFPDIPGIDKKVYASLKWSYDALQKEERSCFLLCCLYPEDAEISIDVLVYQCMARGLLDLINDTVQKVRRRVLTLIDALKDRSLLLDGKNEAAVKIHDVVRDVGLSIAKAEEGYLVNYGVKTWPLQHINENLTAISLGLVNLEEVQDVLVCPKLHTLLLKCQDHSFKIPDNFFSEVKELRVLELDGISMLSIPSSLANLSKLLTLTLAHCWFEDISILKCLKNNLEVLILRGLRVKHLPLELGELSRLRVLDLKRNYYFKIIHADTISKLTHLEELYMPRGVWFHEELSGMETEDVMENRVKCSMLSLLSKLTTLHIHLPDVAKVHDHELYFDGLFRYRVSVGGISFVNLPKTDKMLSIDAVAYHEKLNTLLKRATALCLRSVDGLKKVLNDDKEERAFLELKYLHMHNCHDLDHLIGNPKKYPSSSFSKLTEMHVINCSFRFMFSPSCAKILLQLKKLTTYDCENLKEIVGTEGEKDEQEFKDMICFSNLKELELKNLPKFVLFWPKVEKDATTEGVSSRYALFNEKVTFPYLETLSIGSIPNITEIWCKELHPTESFPQLINVTVSICEKLVNIFPSNMYTRAKKLRSLTIKKCKGIEEVVSITELEESESPKNGTNISFQLQKLSLTNLEKLKSFCGSSRRSKLQCLFDPQVTFPSLETLSVESIPNITEIWCKELHPTDSFPQLIKVKVWNCEKLVNVFPSNMYAQAKNLRSLIVGECKGMEVVVSVTELEESECPNNGTSISFQLENLSLTNLENLKRFCGSSRRSKSQCLFDPQVTFPALERIMIEGLPSMTEMWNTPTESFPSLASVSVFNCDKLVVVFPPRMFTCVQKLKEVSIKNCKGVEVVVSVTGIEESEAVNNWTITFPQLRTLGLFNLENLKTFCGNSTQSEPQPLLEPQIKFPAIQYLYIDRECWYLSGQPKKEYFDQQISKIGESSKMVGNGNKDLHDI